MAELEDENDDAGTADAVDGQVEEIEKGVEAGVDRIDEANVVVERMEKATVEMNKASARLEKLRVQDILGGKASAGGEKVRRSPEQVVEDNAYEYLKGSGMEDLAFPDRKK